MTRNSLAVAIEALSWMAYAGLGERTALFKAAEQIGVDDPDELRQAHRLIMQTTRFQNRVEYFVSQAVGETRQIQHGIVSFLRILAYLTYVDRRRQRDLERNVKWARQILGWRELHAYEEPMALLASGTIDAPAPSLTDFERLALETCHPAWFVERLIRLFGRDSALKALRRNLQSLPTYVRINSLKITNQNRKDKITSELGGSKAEQIQYVRRLDATSQGLIRSNLFASGEVVIQDLASIVASLVASPKPGSTVFDMCAAPGNKTSHLAAQMENDGEILSIEISSKRLLRWKKEMARTGVSIATPIRADAKRIPIEREADFVLVDPPCSNTGVLARNPSIKWKVTQARVNDFALTQYSILRAASEHVASHGTIVYCTCSILPEENEYVLEAFLRREPDFKLIPQTPFLGSTGLRGFDLCQRFYPHLHDCNGYFIAKIQRRD